MNTNPEKDPPIDRHYREQDARWERERVAPVGEAPTEEDLCRSLAKTLPKRLAVVRRALEAALHSLDIPDVSAHVVAHDRVTDALHDIRNIENGVLALCECVNTKGET